MFYLLALCLFLLLVTITREPKPKKSFAPQFPQPDALMAEGTWLAEPKTAPPPDFATLEAALHPILERLTPPPPGPLRGFIDRITGPLIEGWAQDTENPELPQWLEFTANNKPLGRALACHHRADLEAANIGTGHAHFHFTAPHPVTPATLKVRRLADGVGL